MCSETRLQLSLQSELTGGQLIGELTEKNEKTALNWTTATTGHRKPVLVYTKIVIGFIYISHFHFGFVKSTFTVQCVYAFKVGCGLL